MKRIIFSFTALFFAVSIFAQVGISESTITPETTSILELNSNSKGFLVPRLTVSEKNGISSPAQGLLIYQTDIDSGFWYFEGAVWKRLLSNNDSANTLDQAYDQGGTGQGRIIVADNGAVLLQGTDGFQVTGVYGSGAALDLAGAGTRMIFNPRKAAFRAGRANSTEWDNTNVGPYSFAGGYTNTASGIATTALGYDNTASGNYSTAIGSENTSSGANSTAIGFNNNATGNLSNAFGYQLFTPSYGEVAFGYFNSIYSPSSTTNFNNNDRLFSVGKGLSNSTRANAITIYKSGLVNINDAYNLPSTDGTNGQVLKTNGSGTTDWAVDNDIQGFDIANFSGGILSLSLDNNATTTTINLSNDNDWSITGNSGVTASNFIGSINNVPVIIRTGNTEAARFNTDNSLSVATTTAIGMINTGQTGTMVKEYDIYNSNTSSSSSQQTGIYNRLNNTSTTNARKGIDNYINGQGNLIGLKNEVVNITSSGEVNTGIQNTMTTTTSSTTYGVNNTHNNRGTGVNYGIYNALQPLTTTASTQPQYLAYNRYYHASTSSRNGAIFGTTNYIYNRSTADIEATYNYINSLNSSDAVATNNYVYTNAANGINQGTDNYIVANSTTGTSIGTNNYLSGQKNIGLSNDLRGVKRVGVKNQFSTNGTSSSGAENNFGGVNNTSVGTDNNFTSSSTSSAYQRIGMTNTFTNSARTNVGTRDSFSNPLSSATNYGSLRIFRSNSAGSYGYGSYNDFTGAGSGNQYGSYTTVTNTTGTSYGHYVNISPGTTSTGLGYGVWANVTNNGSGVKYAGFFSTSGSGNYGIRANNPTSGGFAGSFGGNVESFNHFPSIDDSYDLGSASMRWDDVFATNGTVNTSDMRDKKEVERLDYGLDEVMKLKPVTYKWKESYNNGTKIGFIAQDLLTVVPEVVKTHNVELISELDAEGNVINEYTQEIELERLGVYYSDLIPVLTKAIQEQQAIIKQLEARIKALEVE